MIKFVTKNKSLPYMKGTLSDFMVHSIGLANSSHYDVFDDTITITTWVKDTKTVVDCLWKCYQVSLFPFYK